MSLWPAVSFFVVALGYAGVGPRVFGKRKDGTLAPFNAAVLGPYLAMTYGLWMLERLVSREPCCQEIAPGIWLGRRLRAGELPVGVRVVVDLTAEFHEPRGVRLAVRYLSLPILDASSPPDTEFVTLLNGLAVDPGPLLFHCASGHGRSALVAAGLLLWRGLAIDEREAEAKLRAVRPGVRLGNGQRLMLRRVLEIREALQSVERR